MIRKFIGLTLICAVIYVAFFLLENCHSEGGGKQPLASAPNLEKKG